MALLEELKKIKHLYGEEFMHLCREKFPTILESEGVLLKILQENFSNNSRTLASDLKDQGMVYDFTDYIFAKYNLYKQDMEMKRPANKDVFELLKEAGYDLYEATTEEEIQSYIDYYAEGEELCTFDGNRLDRCVCFWAIKNDAKSIKREKFAFPQREDEYSTSVLAIQFTKYGRCTVSIKSRYNHTVANPDATYSNDLDRITPGLTTAFGKYLLKEKGLELDVDTNTVFHLNGYTHAVDGRYYKYNLYTNGVFYCPGNIVASPKGVKTLGDPEQIILMDNFVLDIKNKTLKLHRPNDHTPKDDFENSFSDITKIRRTKDKKTGNTKLIIDVKDGKFPIYITLDEQNNIFEYENANHETIGNNFMKSGKKLNKIKLPNVKTIGNGFLNCNIYLRELEAPVLQEIGHDALSYNATMKEVSLPNLTTLGDKFLTNNFRLAKISLTNIKTIGSSFLPNCEKVDEFVAPQLEQVGHGFMKFNRQVTKIDLPNLKEVGDNFFAVNDIIKEVNLPNLEKAGNDFLRNVVQIKKIDFPKLVVVKNKFMMYNKEVEEARLPNLESVGESFMQNASNLKKIEAPKLKEYGKSFLTEAPIEIRESFKKEEIKKPTLRELIASLDVQQRVRSREVDRIRELFERMNARNVDREIPDDDNIGGR